MKIEKTNVFYPNALMSVFHKLQKEYNDFRYKPVTCILLIYLSPLIAPFIPIWYIMDVLANILDWLCFKIFVIFPLWGLTKVEEHEKLHGRA